MEKCEFLSINGTYHVFSMETNFVFADGAEVVLAVLAFLEECP